MQKLSEKVRTLRERRGLSQRALASALGVTHTHIQNLEKGRGSPNVDFVVKLAAYFGLTPNDLLLDEVELE